MDLDFGLDWIGLTQGFSPLCEERRILLDAGSRRHAVEPLRLWPVLWPGGSASGCWSGSFSLVFLSAPVLQDEPAQESGSLGRYLLKLPQVACRFEFGRQQMDLRWTG